jgi:hypothetical protein
MRPTCGICRFELWMLDGPRFGVHVCRRCDTVDQGHGQRVGPPNSPGTTNGWFAAPFGDTK